MTGKTTETPIDMAAVRRVAQRVGLQNLVLKNVQASRFPSPGARGTLQPSVHHVHSLVSQGSKTIEVESKFNFAVKRGEATILKALFVYSLSYAVTGDEPVDDSDARAFAGANGPYHSWPFVREMLFGMTSKMGLPPFLLPVLTFQPPSKQTKAKPRGAASVAVQRRLRRRLPKSG